MKAVIIIPARLASTRLSEKLLQKVGGKTILQHTYERARQSKKASRVIIAADDERIRAAACAFGGEVVMTNRAHRSGTERVAEAARDVDADIVVNVQGDEPEMEPEHIDRLISAQAKYGPFASTLVCPFPSTASVDNPARVKAVLGPRLRSSSEHNPVFNAIFFTRAPAPFPRDGSLTCVDHFLHIGIYAFKKQTLLAFARMREGINERIEKLEQLRIVEERKRIIAVLVDHGAPGIDTPDDLAAFRARFEKR
ncbi:MAG: 3-deoxy-manno-octulosonate cytidylyltransferase [Parvularculaceae bacterium]